MKRLIILIIILGTLVGGFFLWWKNGMSAVDPSDKTQKIFVIKRGAGLKEISNDLSKEGLIKSPIVFFLYTRRQKLEGKIQSGDFRLSPSMDTEAIAKEITHGTIDIWVTIPEGKRAGEIGQILKSNVPSYSSSWENILDKYEGYLFPDTYLFPKDATIDLVVSLMTNNFQNKYASIENAPKSSQDKEEIVIIASMIEREAKLAADRPLVSSVIHNRLNINMALQIDASIQYALGYQEDKKTWWKRALTKDDLALNSLYNTYLNPGLPPKPISNPGLNTLNAAVNPASTNFLYYVSDKNGKNHYAQTLEEHNANIRKYMQ